jgi:hypothetical protein
VSDDPRDPKPLEYEPLKPQSTGQLYSRCISGAFVGAMAVFIIGCFGSGWILPWPGSQGQPKWHWITAMVWIFLAVSAGIGAAITVKKEDRIFIAGFLIGAAVAALCEGICYASS